MCLENERIWRLVVTATTLSHRTPVDGMTRERSEERGERSVEEREKERGGGERSEEREERQERGARREEERGASSEERGLPVSTVPPSRILL